MFVGLTISNMEPENLANVLRRPLLSDHVQEVSWYFPLIASLFQDIINIQPGFSKRSL